VARVLICEPHPEVRELLRLVVVRLGHEPLLDDAELAPVDAILLEPAHLPSVERAQAFRAADGDTPIVCASIELPDAGSRRLGPIVYLVKPFALPDLKHALKRALSSRNKNGAAPRT
jgi:CheY-like chemotaxis protein